MDRGQQTEKAWRGRFIDLRTLTAALSDRAMTLDQASETFGTAHRKLGDVEHGRPLSERYLDYLRRDVLVTHELYERAKTEFARHPIALDASDAYSSASIGKAYLEEFRVLPFLERSALSDEQLGLWLSAFYGGRAECRIRGQWVPVTYLDVRSMYPTVFTLMRLTHFFRAGEISCRDATEQTRELIEELTLDDLFRPDTWPKLTVLCEVEPNEDILPIRMQYGGTARSIGINYLTSNETWWYSLADVLASKLLTGKAPRIRRALRLTADGTTLGLRTVKLRATVPVNPRRGELFKAVIEERERIRADNQLPAIERDALQQFLKTFANATSFGITAELNRKDDGKPSKLEIHSRRSFETQVAAIEKPGRYCFPPLATLITGGARLILAMLERCVMDHGGSYVFMDTDSIALVTDYCELARSRGEEELNDRPDAIPIHAVDEIVERFASLNPYELNGSILKIEDENYAPDSGKREPLYARAVSAKRYALFNIDDQGQPLLRKFSEHGLGTYQPPTGGHDADLLD